MRAVDAAELPLPGLADVDHERSVALRVGAPASEFGGGQLRNQNSKCAGTAALIRAAMTVSNKVRSASAPGATQRTSRACIAGASPTTANTRPPGLSCRANVSRQHRRRAGQHDRIVGARCPIRARRRRLQLDAAEPGALELDAGLGGERRIDLHARHSRAHAGEQRREISAAGADLEHALAGDKLELLQDARLHLRRPHRSTRRQRNLEIGEREQRDAPPERSLRGARRTAGRGRSGRALPTCGSAARPC